MGAGKGRARRTRVEQRNPEEVLLPPTLGKLKWPYPVEHCAMATCGHVFFSEEDAAFLYRDLETNKMAIFCENCALDVELNHAQRFKLIAL